MLKCWNLEFCRRYMHENRHGNSGKLSSSMEELLYLGGRIWNEYDKRQGVFDKIPERKEIEFAR
ncbi:hypothetical protein [Candidatus Endomicrobiellum agilis]|uniref:hypothetical protein n=1 Tax=Candidatus Endomicrobiellum agilis TaxID=3238957 RepID=UPI0028432703|nr:hypothetical protein [Endomicrobium sp.]MDR3092800.1 hypothetical protein [Endomicrobium sp.]